MNNIKKTLKVIVKGLFNPDNKLSLIPNWLSASRGLCGLVIPILVYNSASFEIILGTVCYAALSDFLDGKAARLVAREETNEGAMLDAISDKTFAILLMTFLIPIVNTIAINLILEAVISVINAKTLANGGKPKSNLIGKIKTWPLFISLGFSYLGLSLANMNIDSQTIMNLSSAFSMLSIPLEIMSAKKYLNSYQNTKTIQNTAEVKKELTEEKQNEKEKNDEIKNYGLKLDKNNNTTLMVFENPNIQDDYELDKGRQKKIEF